MPTGKFRRILLGAGTAILLGMAVYFLTSSPRLTEESLRDTSGITVRTDPVEMSDSRVIIPCHVTNHSQRKATSIVFTAEVTTGDGRVLAANPLGNVLELQPGDERTIRVPLPPIADLPSLALSRARIDLVRWAD